MDILPLDVRINKYSKYNYQLQYQAGPKIIHFECIL